jgi:hypothetical protein
MKVMSVIEYDSLTVIEKYFQIWRHHEKDVKIKLS